MTVNGIDWVIKGSDIRKMRLRANRTTSDMARIVGLKTRKTYENWEKNTGTPNINQFVLICRACKLSPVDVIDLALKREVITDGLNFETLPELSPKKEALSYNGI